MVTSITQRYPEVVPRAREASALCLMEHLSTPAVEALKNHPDHRLLLTSMRVTTGEVNTKVTHWRVELSSGAFWSRLFSAQMKIIAICANHEVMPQKSLVNEDQFDSVGAANHSMD